MAHMWLKSGVNRLIHTAFTYYPLVSMTASLLLRPHQRYITAESFQGQTVVKCLAYLFAQNQIAVMDWIKGDRLELINVNLAVGI